jgi:hypothetical protein
LGIRKRPKRNRGFLNPNVKIPAYRRQANVKRMSKFKIKILIFELWI